MSDETTAARTPPDESQSVNTPGDSVTDSTSPDDNSTNPKRKYDTSSMSKCVICGGRHDRRDKYGKCAICAQCHADLRHERLSRIAPAVMRGKMRGEANKRSRQSRGGKKK